MNRTVNGDVQQDVDAERDIDTAPPGLTVSHQLAAGVGSEAKQQLLSQAASHQVVVGEIPVRPHGFQPRAGLLAELDRAGARVSVIHAGTGLHGLGATQLAGAYARAKLEAGWRLVAWVSAANTDSLLAGLAAVAEAAGLTDDDSGPGIPHATPPCGTGLRPTVTAACWCSTMCQTLRRCKHLFRPTVWPGY